MSKLNQSSDNLVYDKTCHKYLVARLNGSRVEDLARFLSALPLLTTKLFHPHPLNRDFLNRVVKNKDVRVILYTTPKEVVGYSFISRLPILVNKGYFGIVISEKFRGRGLAKGLMDKLFQLAKKEGINEIILNVRSDNPAAFELYKKMGFVQKKLPIATRYLITAGELIKNGELIQTLLNLCQRSNLESSVYPIWMVKTI